MIAERKESADSRAPRDEGIDRVGEEAHALMQRLFGFCRSLTGDGVRQTLRALQDIIPLEIHEVPTGTRLFDWVVPDEWNIRDAFVADMDGRRVIDFRASNLHIAGYSAPVDEVVPRETLLAHVFTNPSHPDTIPYRHFYYRQGWGFCIPHAQLAELTASQYRVVIDATLAPGSLTYGELAVPGSCPDEVFVSTHTCHPSMCNDNLSGIVTAALLARDVLASPRRHGFRFVFVPATLGALAWLAANEEAAHQVCAGLVIAGVGDPGPVTYMRSRRGDAAIDRAVVHALEHAASGAFSIRDFAPVGYDQRQYCSPGFDMPLGCFMRTPNGEYPEYHTSADDLSFVSAAALGDSWRLMRLALDIADENRTFINLSPKGEPRLGPRGLFDEAHRLGLFWILNLSDGRHSLLDIAERANMPFQRILEGARRLEACQLLVETDDVRRDPAPKPAGAGRAS